MIKPGQTAILDRNIFFERFVTYNLVFKEYFKTMTLIDKGETLKYETYDRLTRNFLTNVKNHINFSNNYLAKYQLEETKLAEYLDQYFMALINSLNCMNIVDNSLNHQKLQQSKIAVETKLEKFVRNISFDLG